MKARAISKSVKLHSELKDYALRIANTNLLLSKFITLQELNRTGLLLTPKQAKEQAEEMSKKMIDCNLIQNGLLVDGMLEHILEVCNDIK